MPDMNGIDTCRALREQANWQGHVIFVSAHNDMETRLRAYDAGGNDYIVKPVNAEELLQKVSAAEAILQQQRGLQEQVAMASSTAFAAMSSMGELGVVLQFLRTSFNCTSCGALATELLNALRQYELDGLVEMHISGQTYAVSNQGDCSPLEQSILHHGRGMGHQFQFRDRLVINYPAITLVASRLPVDNPDMMGRLRDHLALLAEGASARLAALASETKRQAQDHGIHDALAALSAILEGIEKQQATYRLNALSAIDQYVSELEHAYVHLELTQNQENALSNMARRMAEKLGCQLSDSREVGHQLQAVVARLQTLGEQ